VKEEDIRIISSKCLIRLVFEKDNEFYLSTKKQKPKITTDLELSIFL